MTTYVTFGQEHRHEINGKIFDKNCVAIIKSKTQQEGREKAFKLFGRKFCFEYFNAELSKINESYFPRGFISVE